jgi:hypothetical protein
MRARTIRIHVTLLLAVNRVVVVLNKRSSMEGSATHAAHQVHKEAGLHLQNDLLGDIVSCLHVYSLPSHLHNAEWSPSIVLRRLLQTHELPNEHAAVTKTEPLPTRQRSIMHEVSRECILDR